MVSRTACSSERRHGRRRGSACRGTRTGRGPCRRPSRPPRAVLPWRSAPCTTAGTLGTVPPLGCADAVLRDRGCQYVLCVGGVSFAMRSTRVERTYGQAPEPRGSTQPFTRRVRGGILTRWHDNVCIGSVLIARGTRSSSSLGVGTGLARAAAESPVRCGLFRRAPRVGRPGWGVGARGCLARRATRRAHRVGVGVATRAATGRDTAVVIDRVPWCRRDF